jgi:hypothetical protein
MKITHPLLAALLCAAAPLGADFWPAQKPPRGVVRSTNHEYLITGQFLEDSGIPEGAFGVTHAMLQSLSGLLAQSVNEGRSDEMLWIEVGHPEDHLNQSYRHLYERVMTRLELEDRGAYSPWELVRRYRDRELIRGYVLYSFDSSAGGFEEERRHLNQSLNIATSMAGLVRGIVVEESLEPIAKELGLPMLYDARDVDGGPFFRDRLEMMTSALIGQMDPKVPNQRDYLIAHQAPVWYGYDDTMAAILGHARPLSPVIGWNAGDERKHTQLVSDHALFNTASNRVMNLPLLSAATGNSTMRVPGHTTESASTAPAVAFVLSDGDNMSWFLGEILTHPDYMGNAERGRFPLTWTTCLATLRQTAVDGYEAFIERLAENEAAIEFTGGYFFPEEFGKSRAGQDHLRAYSRRLAPHLAATGQAIFHFMVIDPDSEGARAAYQIFADELPSIEAMTVTQYAPYEGGGGRIHWVTNAAGNELPIITAAYALWEGRSDDRRGDPAHLASVITRDFSALDPGASTDSKYRWAVIHAWSRFPNEKGEMERGLNPVWRTMEAIDGVDLVTIPELVRRIRADRAASRAQP